MLEYIPDWFATAKILEDFQCKVITAYKQSKTQKTRIKKELWVIAWYPNRVTGVSQKMKKRS